MLCKCSGKYIDIYFNLKITFLVIPSFGVPGVGCAPVPLLYFVRSPLPYGFKATSVYLDSFYRDIQ